MIGDDEMKQQRQVNSGDIHDPSKGSLGRETKDEKKGENDEFF
jgi:hypothetical protein